MCHRRESPFCWQKFAKRVCKRIQWLQLRSPATTCVAEARFVKWLVKILHSQRDCPCDVHPVSFDLKAQASDSATTATYTLARFAKNKVRLLQHALKKPTVSPFRAAYWVFPLDFRPICAPQQRRGYIFKVLTLPSWPLQAHPPLGALKIWLRADELGCAQIRWALRDNSFWVN